MTFCTDCSLSLNQMLKLVINFLYISLTSLRFTIPNRKVLASIQRRKGPNVTGF